MVHWLTNDERNLAKQEIDAIPLMSSIADPFQLVKISYPNTDPDYFHKKILRLKSEGSTSENNRRKSSKSKSSGSGSSKKKLKS